MFKQFAFVASACLISTAAFAQDVAKGPAVTSDGETPATMPSSVDPETALEAANNQLGILKFCEAQGYIGAKATVAQEKIVAMRPAGDAEKASAMEAKGEKGIVVVDGEEISLEQAAKQQGITLKVQCQQIEAVVN